MKPKYCYRFVTKDMKSKHDKITKWKIGKWNKVEGELKPCRFGLHASLTPYESLQNVFGDRWFLAEYRGKIKKDDNKFCASEMRLVKEIPIEVLERFAIECARHVLPIYEKEYPDDKRVRDCIQGAEDYFDGKISKKRLEELRDTAWAAEAARAAARAARAAARAARVARAAVWAAEAARAAARAADAARVARAAVWAARAAVWAARAADAARAAERKWQEKLLNKMVKESLKNDVGINAGS